MLDRIGNLLHGRAWYGALIMAHWPIRALGAGPGTFVPSRPMLLLGCHIARMRTVMLLAFALPLAVVGQQRADEQRITFDLIGVKDGLPHAIVECFLEDQRGVLWVGMQQGLAVYDGHDFIPVDLSDDGAPIGVRSMTKDADGIIWVAAEQGPVRVDPLSRKAELLPFPDSLRAGIQTMWFHGVAVTRTGEVLFGANQGTFFYDVRTNSFRGLHDDKGKVVRTFWRYMHADTARQGVWITSHDHDLLFYHAPSGKLHGLEGESPISPLIGEPILSLCPDGSGGFWCSDRKNGNICHWNGRDRSVRRWDHLPGDTSMKVSRAWYMGRDSKGRIWGSANAPGGFMFDPSDSTAVTFSSDGDRGGLPGGVLSDLHEGPYGELWMANALGIAIHDPSQPQPRVFELIDRTVVPGALRIWSMEFAGDSVLWCGMGGQGLLRVDLRTEQVAKVPITGLLVEDPFVWDVLPLPGRILVACASDVLALDPGSMTWARIDVKDDTGKAPAPGRRWLARDVDGTVWMGLDLFRAMHFDPLTGKGTTHVPDSTRQGALRYDNIYASVSMPDGRTWFGGNLHGLTCFDARTGQWTDLRADVSERRLKVGRIVGMAASGDSVLWLASDGAGLVRYHIATGTYTHFDHRHGISELGLYTAVVDTRGRVWTNSDERVFCFDPQTGNAMAVEINSTTGGHGAKWTLAVSGGGLIAMNTGREVAVFGGNSVGRRREPPPPTITRVLIDGEPTAPMNGQVELPYGREQFDVRFGAFLPPGYIRKYAMRMSGSEWNEGNEGLVSLRGLEPGTYDFELKLLSKEGVWGPVTHLRVYMDPPWWQTLVARILFALLLAVAIVLVFRARLNWVRKRERAQEEQARQLNELKLQALRAQMDPHFIFNCLNSIDSFIIASDREQASHYLGRFAKLIRLILQHSDSTRVPLEREVEMLRYYLELEALRFKTPFTFELHVDEDLEGEPVELPTMLIQPYIENAIWHGLRHKGTAGHLNVRFALRGDRLECIVEDNGIGREASRELNKQRSSVHRSMGMRVSADRLKLYGELEQGASRVEITDLKDAQGNAAGTRVVITIPLMGKGTEN